MIDGLQIPWGVMVVWSSFCYDFVSDGVVLVWCSLVDVVVIRVGGVEW